MVKKKVVVSGVGPISAIGSGHSSFWKALMQGQNGFGPITLCDVSHSPSKIGAEVKNFQLEDFILHGHALGRRLPRPVQFALAAASLALEDAGIDLSQCNRERVGINVGTSIGNIEASFLARDKYGLDRPMPAPTAFGLFNHNAACILSSHFDLHGPIHTTTTGCNSGLDALGYASRLIQLGVVDAMLVVGTDCELVSEVMATLNASGSLSTHYNQDPARASRPFDVNRDGNVLGEGAAGLFLESEDHAHKRGFRSYARVAGYSTFSAGRRTYSHDHPEISTRASVSTFRGTMADAEWTPAEIDLINANGSSSVLYDTFEAMALSEVLGDSFSSTRVHSIKSMLGQHGAGSSALQAVAACLSLRYQMIPPTINHERTDPACGPLWVVTQAESYPLKKILVNSIGFGGFYYSCGAFGSV